MKLLDDTMPMMKSHKMTARDGGNVGIIAAVQVVLYWLLHDVVGIEIPPEVVGALSAIITYVCARKMRY